ncbi:MAG: AMP-binding protein [Burkholderiaceae bacterium]
MAKDVDMLDLLNSSKVLDATVGWRAGKPIRRDAFLAAVDKWQVLLKGTQGQKFALYFSDSLQFAEALLGAWQAGKTIYLPADTLAATCEALSGTVDGYVGEFPSECKPVNASEVNDGAKPVDAYGFQPLAPDFVGLVVYTSGSTGAPQSIPKRLAQLAAEVSTLEALFGERLQKADIVATVSHQHIYGLLFKVLWPLTAGRAIHSVSFAYPEELPAVLALNDCVLISSPAHLKRLPDTPIWNRKISHLQAVFSSGGPLSLDAAKASANLLGQIPIEVYGSSETGGIAWRQREDASDECWTPMPGVKWRIEPDQDLLEVCSAHLADDNWLTLSDRVTSAQPDRFQLHGRVDRIVKIEEKRVSLDTIEKQLINSSLVEEARVLVIDGTEGQRQRIAAFIVLTAEGKSCFAEIGKLALNRKLRSWLSACVEIVALPRSWRYLDALPINAQGKTTSAALMALLDEVNLGVARPRLPHQQIIEKGENRIVFTMTAPHDLFYFDGHFTESPILAGVVQVEWAIAYARQHFDMPPVFRGIQALKFQHVIQPEKPFELELVFEPQKSTLAFRYHSSAGQHSSGRLRFEVSDV